MKKLLLITFLALFALISKAQYFDYQVKGWQLQVDTTYSKGDLPEETGSRYWDEDDLTTSLVLPNGVVLQDGHELFFDVLNQTGDTLENGRVAAYAGDVGASGKIKAIYGIANYTLMHPKYILGIVTHDILNGEQGKITFFGKVRGIQTNGANYGETWSDGEVLYVSSSVTGYLTKVQPNAPYPAIPIAVVVKAHATMGTLLVRPTFPTRMQDLADVNGTPLTTKGQIPVWNQAEEFFDFNYNIWPDLISNEGYGSSWDGVDSIAPSKNAIYDKLQTMEPVSYCPTTMTVNRGTLVAGTAADLCNVGGTDVQITELNGTDPLRVTFAFSGVTKVSSFVFYGDYNGGASHVVWVEAYNYTTSAWDYLGQFMTSPSKAWYSFPMYNSLAYISGGAVQVRLNHQGTGVNTHNLYLDYVDVDFGGGGTSGATNLSYTASATNGIVNSDTGTDATIPAGSTTNASLMLPADKTKLDGIATQADRYSRWYLRTALGYTGIFSSDYLDLAAGTGISIGDNLIAGGRIITFTNSAPMVYPGAGIPLSTGSAWGTSITNNSSNWNAAYTHKTTEDALNGLVKVNGAGSYSAVTDNSTNWNSAFTNMGKVALATAPTTYRNLNGSYFSDNGSNIVLTLDGTPTNNSVIPVTSDGIYDALQLKQNNITLTTTGTSGAATFDGTTLNIPQYSGGGTNYWQSGTGYIAPATITDEVRIGSISDQGDYKLQVTGNSKLSGQLALDWSSGGSTYALYTTSNSNLAAGYFRNSSTGGALYASSETAVPAIFEISNPSAGNTIETVLTLQRFDDGTIGTGAGARLMFKHESASGSSSVEYASIASKATTVTAGSEAGSLIFSTVNAGSMSQKASLDKDGIFEAVEFKVSALNTAPASATATGTTGEIRITSGYIYVCTATNTWVRAALATW